MKYKLYDIDSVECIGNFEDEYVYDLEMQNNTEHTFFANDILVHNSNYITIKPLLDSRGISLIGEDKKITEEAEAVAVELEEVLNKEITEWAQKQLNSSDPRFIFKREAICDVGLFLEKKRYILNIKNDEGVNVNKMKFVGMEVARSSFSDPVKDIIKKIVLTIFEARTASATNNVYREGYEKFKKLSLDDISIRVSIKDYDKWANKSERYTIAKNTPVHVKGAIYFNELLEDLGIQNDYEKITSGGKIKWFYCNKNKYNINAISYNGSLPKEISKEIEPDYKKMFEKLITSSVERIFKACDWQMDDLSYEYSTNLFDFFA